MRESVTYQAVLEEGREEGSRTRGQQAALSLLRANIPIDLIVEASGLSIAEVTQLKQANHL
jgi:predicted transposase YdaD